MELDVYSPCPGGLNKKIKFCCHDLLGPLNHVERQIRGDQLQQALQTIEDQLAETPDRPCLLAIKITSLLDAGKLEEARATSELFAAKFPQNAVALALATNIRGLESKDEELASIADYSNWTRRRHEETQALVDMLQSAMEACEETLPVAVAEAYEILVSRLLRQGEMIAARDHLMIRALLSDPQESPAMQQLGQFMADPSISSLIKGEYYFAPAPDDFPGKVQYDEAAKFARRGQWRRALQRFESLSESMRETPLVLHARGLLQARLARSTEAAQLYRRLAEVQTDPQDSLEAEAMSVLLHDILNAGIVEDTRYVVEVESADIAFERFHANRRFFLYRIDWRQTGLDGPPPKGAFILLDQPFPTEEEWKRILESKDFAAIPVQYSTILLFGRETDRRARVEFVIPDLPFLAEGIELVKTTLGDQWEEPKRDVVAARSITSALRSLAPMVPPAGTEDDRDALLEGRILVTFLNHWGALPQTSLDGKTPQQAAEQPNLRRRVEGLLLTYAAAGVLDSCAHAALRSKLGLPPISDQLGWTGAPFDCPAVRLAYLDPAKLDNTQIQQLLGLAVRFRSKDAVMRLGHQLLERDIEGEKIERWMVLSQMAMLSPTFAEQNTLAQRAAHEAIKAGHSPATSLILQMEACIVLGDAAEFQRIFQTIQTKYLKEPGIQDAMTTMLVRHGLIRPRSQQGPEPTTTVEMAQMGGPTNAPTSVLMGDAPADPPAAEGKSKLWLPD